MTKESELRIHWRVRPRIPWSIASAMVLSMTVGAGADAPADGLDEQSEIVPFVEQMRVEHGVDTEVIGALLRQAEVLPGVIDAISRPAEAKPWRDYRPIFLTDERIVGGVGFWREHRAALERAEQTFGVPPEVVIAIIGVETFYGRRAGRLRVLDSLATLAFRYQRRAKFFRRELTEFLLLVEEEDLDPLTIVGSYAGAMGIPQFISSSYRSYAVDFDGDERRDLLGNPTDAIGSVASYLARHGWRRGEPVAAVVTAAGNGIGALLEGGLKPHATVGEMEALGVSAGGALAADLPAAVVELQGLDGTEHWIGTRNFYAITRYNHSKLYAMAVHQLAILIRAEFEGADA